MSRKLRLEYAGAIYHVISRGNYRADVFRSDKTKAAFLRCLDEVCQKADWIVHAWAMMSNHYHLCLETPQPNLVEGMQWLQGTFAVRFNRLRNERGHLFQGRYQALLVDPEAVGAVCHYIHFNPVRAHLIPVDRLGEWRWTSFAWMIAPPARPDWYQPDEALRHAGDLADNPAGWRRYLEYLRWLQTEESEQKRLEFNRLAKDWAIGSGEFKHALLEKHRDWAVSLARGDTGPRELSRTLWETRLQRLLAALGKAPAAVAAEPKGAPWKVAVAATMKATTTASNPWLTRHLQMGSLFRLCRLVRACRENPQPYRAFLQKLARAAQ